MPFLEEIDDEARAALSVCLEEARVSAGSRLISQGGTNDRLWFVAKGSVAIERSGPGGGPPEVLATLPAPSVFGTTTFFRPEMPASATIRATTDLHLWTLDRASHERLRRDDPRAAEVLAMAIIRVLSERFDLLDRHLAGQLAGAGHGRDRARASELAAFRTRLFEEPGI